MISFFKISTSYKFIFLALLFIIIRLPVFLYGLPVLSPELNWMLVAERIRDGYQLYSEIWDDISPLSALVYWVIYSLFGKSYLVLQILAALLVFVQALMLNHFLLQRDIYPDRSLVPALLYIVLTVSFLDLFTLSPALMANTFLIIVMRYLFLHISERRKYNSVFEIGAYIGLATLFYIPSFLIILVPIISFLIYTGTKFKDYLLMGFAFLFTVGTAALNFFINNSEYEFYLNVIQSIFYLKPQLMIHFWGLFKILFLVFALALFAIFQPNLYRKYNNYQHRCQFFMSLWLFVSLLSVFLNSEVSTHSFLICLPALVFILSHYFLNVQSTLRREIPFALILLTTLFFNYSSLFGVEIRFSIPLVSWAKVDLSIDHEKLLAQSHPQDSLLKGKKIWVAGDEIGNYIGAGIASPYLDWRLSQRHFNQLNQYLNVKTTVYENIFDNERGDIPEVIIDIDSNAYHLFQNLPLAAQSYQKIPKTNIYLKKKKKVY